MLRRDDYAQYFAGRIYSYIVEALLTTTITTTLPSIIVTSYRISINDFRVMQKKASQPPCTHLISCSVLFHITVKSQKLGQIKKKKKQKQKKRWKNENLYPQMFYHLFLYAFVWMYCGNWLNTTPISHHTRRGKAMRLAPNPSSFFHVWLDMTASGDCDSMSAQDYQHNELSFAENSLS